MAKSGESVIDAHNERILKLQECIQVEIDKMCTLTEQLDKIEELIEKANEGECPQPIIVGRRNDSGQTA